MVFLRTSVHWQLKVLILIITYKCNSMKYQHQHMTKKFSVFIRMRGFVMDLKKFWDAIENWSPVYDLQVANLTPFFSFFLSCISAYWFLSLFCFVIGPTSFAPVIEMAITIVEQSGGQYHVLLIIADGQVIVFFFFYIFHSLRWVTSISVQLIWIFHPFNPIWINGISNLL
jgi:hypothetical protein